MRHRRTSHCHQFLVLALIGSTLTSTIATSLWAAPPFLERVFPIGVRQGQPPKAAEDPAMEGLARNIDWLEHEIDRWGTVVAKAPDVWGEARLTKYRAEVDKQLQQDVVGFLPNQIHGAQIISDQAFLAAALALKSQPALPAGRSRIAVPTATVTVANSTASSADAAVAADASATPGTPAPFGMDNTAKKALLDGLVLEQTEVLDQKKRYLDHLSELRRLNDGDDVSDAPGYSLNLVRIPVSILPGKHSREGYGAEITVTATPELGPELLPIAFRDFVINDLVDQLSVPLVQFLNTDPKPAREVVERLEAFEEKHAKLSRQFAKGWIVFKGDDWPELLKNYSIEHNLHFNLFDLNSASFPAIASLDEPHQRWLLDDALKLTELLANLDELNKRTAAIKTVQPQLKTEDMPTAQMRSLYKVVKQQATSKVQAQGAKAAVASDQRESNSAVASSLAFRTQIELLVDESDKSSTELTLARDQLESLANSLHVIDPASLAITKVNIPSSSRRSTLPFPPSQLLDNYGMHDLAHVVLDAYRAFEQEIINRQVIHLTDVRGYLREEISAAYDMMSLPVLESFWAFEASGEKVLVEALRHRRTAALDELRKGFRSALAPHMQHSSTLSLAWCVFIESLLLNERILDEMTNSGAGRVWLPLFGPNPPCEARDAFAAYVAQRWPVKVFAIDPVVTEQNIADVSSISRQMQLAVALAFAGGEIGASAAMQTLRQLQRDTAAIDLNRTIVGFGHGENTFGWRFYPRFQTPPVEGNATVFLRDLVAGGPTDKQLLRSKQIEPGMRECVAIVLMPNFVPNVTFDTRGNWFKLDKPSHTAMSMLEIVKYSRAIVAMRENAVACTRCVERYRPGELNRLLNRVQQLDAELPLQSLRVPLPIENSHGGFEIFSSGTHELAPELLGWYGAPGYDVAKGGTFFLAGDNFSVHETKLIVGNQCAKYELVSRQVLQVTLDPGLQIIQDERLKEYHTDKLGLSGDISHYLGFVDAHVATPYGVSGHLLIPVIQSDITPPMREYNVQLVSADIQASLQLTKAEGKPFGVAGNLETPNMPLIVLEAPAIPGLANATAKITIQPIALEGRLTPVAIDGIPRDAQRLMLHGSKAIATLQEKGDLYKSIAEYVVWRANRANSPSQQDFDLTCDLLIEIGGIKFTTTPVIIHVALLEPK